MELKSFREKKKKKIGILVFTICCIFLIAFVFFYQSFALFEVQENFNLIEGNVGDIGDISFTYYKDDAIVLEMPSKESGYTLDEKSNCTNGVQMKFNIENWEARLDYSNYTKERISNTTCKLYFREATYSDYVTSCGENGGSASECMQKYENKDTTNLLKDGTVDNNLRYVGANPNNYVRFNDELWRIIGVMNNIDDGTGKKETRLKIIRNESIGSYSWDNSSIDVNEGMGVSDWSQSDLMRLLNPGYEEETVNGSLYWNRNKGNCYHWVENGTIECNFNNSGLLEESKNLIATTLWRSGASIGGATQDLTITTNTFYEYERSNNLEKENNSSSGSSYCNAEPTNTTWIGKVALPYPSDYGFATGGGESVNRVTCLENYLTKWGNANCVECRINSYLLPEENGYWTLTPTSDNPHNAFVVNYGGSVAADVLGGNRDVRPTLYLKTNVKIVNGNGTKEQPYILKI